jgi:Undecaprenyl-phosphate galactose phosphotransferase WbaP
MRWLVKFILKKQGLWVRPTVIIGHGNNALDAQNALHSEPSLGFQVVGFVDVDCLEPRLKYESQVKLDYIGLQLLAKRPGVQWVIALEHSQSDQREEWLRKLASWGAQDINVIPAMRGVPLYGTNISHFFSHEVALLRVHNNLRRWPARLSKRIFDTLLALVLIVLLSPLLLLLSLLLLGDGGKVIFSQKRVGKNGRTFNCFKFRTMALDAEDQLKLLLAQSPEHKLQWEKDQKLKDDPRVSALGGFLRRTSLDELPQLFNVLQGQMSLVGPRPIVEAELQRYGSDASYYLMVRPGMTGLWQVNGRNDLDYESRVYLDTWYVKNWSLWYDLVILIKTIRTVLSSKGAY